MSSSAFTVASTKVSELHREGAIIIVAPSPDQFISHIFTVPKKTPGEFRIIFDLSILNTFVSKVSVRISSCLYEV